MVATRATDGGCGAGNGVPPLVPKCGHRARQPTGTEDSHQHQGGSGAREVRVPTGTEASTPGEVAGSPAGARAAGWGSHGRVRGCPGAAAGRAVVGQRGRRSRRPLHPPVPPHARQRDEEGPGGGGEAEEGAGGGRTAPRQGPRRRASLCRRA